jgi:uncharacterized protein (TIGR03083 family)
MTSPTKQALTQHCQEQLASLRALADELEADDWSAPSLCTGWDVKTVYAHLLYGRLIGPLRMLAGVARHRGRIDRWDDATARRFAASLSLQELREQFARETSRWPERGVAGREPMTAKLADNTVHELDVRWAVGKRKDLPADRLAAALTCSCRTGLWGNTRRVAGLGFVATDLDWSWGAGPAVSGPAGSLLLAVNGRPAGLAGLAGEGLPVLTARLSGHSRAGAG